jgi:hypothetical protein
MLIISVCLKATYVVPTGTNVRKHLPNKLSLCLKVGGIFNIWFPWEPFIQRLDGQKYQRLKPSCFCEIYPETISTSLIPTRHFRRCMP